jgi:hypothetical protein
MIVASIPPKPLVLVGAGWKSVMGSFYQSFEPYIPQKQRDLLHFAADIQTAVELIHTNND